MTKKQRKALCAKLEKAYQALNEASKICWSNNIIQAREKTLDAIRVQVLLVLTAERR